MEDAALKSRWIVVTLSSAIGSFIMLVVLGGFSLLAKRDAKLASPVPTLEAAERRRFVMPQNV